MTDRTEKPKPFDLRDLDFTAMQEAVNAFPLLIETRDFPALADEIRKLARAMGLVERPNLVLHDVQADNALQVVAIMQKMLRAWGYEAPDYWPEMYRAFLDALNALLSNIASNEPIRRGNAS